MNYYQILSIRTIAKKQIYETLISPAFYITMVISLLLSFFLVSGFVDSIGQSGFNASNNFIYDMITKSLAGAFGDTFVMQLFSEGPFFFALFISFLPILIYFAISSIFKFGLEKSVGAIELITYGPADGTSYILASISKNILLTGLSLIGLLVFYIIIAVIYNLVLGYMFFFALILIFFLAFVIYSYCILISVLTDNAAAGIALFLVMIIIFALLQLGSYAIITGYAKNLANLFSSVLQWLSPFAYWYKGLNVIQYGQIAGYFFNICLLAILSFVLLYVSHLIIRFRGVRG